MLIMLKIAIRNVFRNKRRTFLTEMAIIFGAIAIILVGGIFEFMVQGLREQTIKTQIGHIQIHAKGYSSKGVTSPWKYVINDPSRIKKLVEKLPQVKIITERVELSGIVSSGKQSTNFIGIGVVPEKESYVSSGLSILQGKKVGTLSPEGALIGKGLAEGLDITVGDTVMLLTNTIYGSFNAVEVVIEGVFQTGSAEYDKRAIIITIDKARKLLNLNGVTSLIVVLNKTEDTETASKALSNIFLKNKLSLEVVPWFKIATYYKQVKSLFDSIFGTVKIIVAIIVIFGIANTMMMSVLERTKEIGTIMALGGGRKHVMTLFILETLTIGIIGGIAGVIFGVLVTKIVAFIGIPIPPPPGQSTALLIKPLIIRSSIFYTFFISVFTSLLSGLYPAYKATKLKPVDALHHF